MGAAFSLAAATARRRSVLMSPDVATISCSTKVALLTMSLRCSIACSRMVESSTTFGELDLKFYGIIVNEEMFTQTW